MTDDDWNDIRYFARSEFECRCGCGVSNPKKEMVRRLDRARSRAGIPFTIHSGSRCLDHNEEVGGVASSSHVADEAQESTAVDIGARSSRMRSTIVSSLFDTGFTRIGIDKAFVHVDIDPSKEPGVLWLY